MNEIILEIIAYFITFIGMIYFSYQMFKDDKLIVKAINLSVMLMILAAYIQLIYEW